MNGPKPIPIPARHRWREFCVAYLPVITFVMLVVTIGWMWTHYVAPATIIGEVEIVRANVITIANGTVQEIKVQRLQAVTNGQELAVVATMEPDQVAAELAAVEADLRLMKARMDLDKTRNFSSYSQLRNELQLEQLDSDLARIRLRQAENEYERGKKLYDDKIIPLGIEAAPDNYGIRNNEFGYDVALRDRDALRAEVSAHENVVSELQTAVQEMQTNGAVQIGAEDAVIEQAIAAQRERLLSLQKPLMLRSPIDGFVSLVNNVAGERVVEGQPVLVVSAGRSSRISAWVRQPVTVRPSVGDVVEVRRARFGQKVFAGRVIQVGSQLEPINPTAVSRNVDPNRFELGLPLIVQSESALELLPGESVQLRIVQHRAESATN